MLLFRLDVFESAPFHLGDNDCCCVVGMLPLRGELGAVETLDLLEPFLLEVSSVGDLARGEID